MGVKERYEKRKKDGEKSVYNGVKQRYLSNSAEDAASSISDRVNTWLKNHDTYISNYRYRYGDRKNSYDDSYVSDSGSYLDTVTKQKSAFDAEADSILSYMDQYKDYLNADWMAQVRKTLTEARSAQDIVLGNTKKDNEWWSSFGSEEMLKAHGSAEEAYKYYQWDDGLKKKYTGATGDDIQKALDSLGVGEERDWLRINQGKIFGDSIRENTDFQDYVTTGSSLSYDDFGTETMRRGTSRRMRSTTTIDKYRAASLALAEHYGNEAPLGIYDKYDEEVAIFRTMKDEEFENLAYCIAYDKQNGTKTAEQYVNFMEETLSARRGTDIGEKITGIDIPIIEDLAVLGYGALAGVDNFAFGIEQFMSDDEVAYYPSYYANAHIADSLDGLGYYAHSAATNIGNMAPSILVSGVVSGLGVPRKVSEAIGSTTMGVSAAGSAYKEALAKGYDKESARTYSNLVGASEGLLQYLIGGVSKLGGVSNIFSKLAGKISLIDDALLRGAAKYGMSIGSEVFEEEIQNFLEPAFRSIIFGEDYDAPTINEMIETAIVTALSTSVLEGGSTYTGIKEDMALDKQAAKDYGDKTDALIQEGLQNDVKSVSYKLAQKYQQQTQGKDGKNGKAMTGAQIRNLLAANQAEVTKADLGKIQDAAANRLAQVGQREDIYKIAELATKYATGQEMTRAERSTLARSSYGSQVASEMLNGIHPDKLLSKWENNMSEEPGAEYSTDWTGEIDTESDQFIRFNNKKLARAILDHLANSVVEDPASYKSLKSRVEAEEPAQVSDTGKSVIRGTDQEIDLTKPTFKEITDGVGVLEADGKLVSANNIDYADENLGYAIRSVGKFENITPEAAGAVVSLVDMSKPVVAQMNGMDEAFTYGFHNYSEADLKAGLFTENLTPEQLNDAYKLGQYVRSKSADDNTAAIKKMRTAVDAEVEKIIAEGKTVSKGKMTITYNAGNGNVVDFDKAGVKLSTKQKAAPALAKVMHEMGLGTNFELFSSYLSKTMKDEDGNRVRVFLNEKGEEEVAYSGVYRMEDGTVRIDLNAYNGRGLTLDAMSHELTHFIQQWSGEKYEILADFLVKTYEKTDMSMHQRVLREQARLERIRKKDVSYSEAYDEVVANAMSKMLADGKVMERLNELKAQDMELAEKLWEGLKNLLKKFFRAYEKESALFYDAADLMELKEEFEQMQKMWADAFVEASENFQASLTAAENQILTEAGIGFDESTKSVYSLHFSNAFTEQIQVGKKAFDAETIAQLVSKATGRSIEDARDWVKSEMAIANIVMQNPEFLDFEADNRYEAIKKNSDYPQGTVDLSNLCPKREEFTAMFDMLQKKYPNKLFTAQDIADMRKILSENDITVACGACFVEDRRQLIGEIADTFIGMWKEAAESVKPLQKTNAAGNKIDLLVTKALSKQYGLTAGTKIMAKDTYIPNQYDLTTYEGFKLLEKNHPTIAMAFNRYNNSRGQQSARLIEGRAEYKRQILGWSDAKVKSVNNNGGLRIFSFSDFEVVHLLDLVQVIIDCAAKGVKIQGYTKIPAFAKLVRGTGIKLNRSLIPKGDYGYHMENGKVVLDYDTTEGINIHDENFMDESDNPNVGNIVIGINPTQISAAMLDPFIDYIIPFHSNKAKEILRKLGTGEWVNYKESQHEKDISTGKASKHNVNIYTEVINKYHPKNKVEFVEAFLKECKRQGKIPRYAEFLNVDANGDYTYREGYHKLLVDFKMFDKDGNILPQGNITPNLEESFMKKLLNAEIDKKQNYEFPKKVYDAIDKKFGERGSYQEADVDTDADSAYDSAKVTKVTKQEANIDGQDGKAEDHASFIKRMREGSRRVKRIGETVYAYEPARAIDTSGSVSDAARELRKLGIKYFYHNGLEYNHNGITYVDNGALCTIEQQVVGIYAKAFGDGVEFAGHEAFHFWKHSAERNAYVETLKRNIDTSSVYGMKLADTVLKEYFDGDIKRLTRDEAKAQFLEELYALVSGKIYSGTNEVGLKTMFKDYAEVKSAWDKLLKKQTAGKGDRYSSQQTDFDGNTMSDRAKEILANAKPKMIGKTETANIEFDTVRELFNELNADKDIQALADRVFEVAKEDVYGHYGYASYHGEPKSHLRLPMAFVGNRAIPEGVHGQFRKNTIWGDIVFSYDYFMDESVAPQSKASTILHEVIHAVTCSHIESAYRWSQAKQGMFGDPLAVTDFNGVDERIKAGMELIDAFEQVRSAPTKDGKNLYGQLTAYEMVAEMANVEFRNFLKKQNLWSRIVDAIKRIFGIPKTTAYDAVSDALERILTETTSDADTQRAKIEARKANNRYSSQETDRDIGYHAGDLGKAEGHHQQGGGRSTGHFGTGTYFVSNPKSLKGYNSRNGNPAPIEKVDLSKYNLYRIYSDEVGLKLHRNLQVLDGGVSQEFLDAAKRDDYMASDLWKKANKLADSYDNQVWNEDLEDFFSEDYFGSHIRAYTETLQENGVEFQSFEEWYHEYSGESPAAEDYEDYQIDYYDYLKATLEKADEDRNSGYPAFRDTYFDLWLRFGKNRTDAALQNVVNHINKLRPDGEYNYDLEYGQDSNATVFMKSLGYEGINVSGTGLDNTTYGSVVYDLKGEDLARKKAIGTARYSGHETDDVSNRHLLANAFEGISQNSIEYKMIQDYKNHIQELNKLEEKLSDLNQEIRKIRFGTEGRRDTAKLEQLENEAKEVAKEINRYDKRLLNMEASEPLRKVIDRERAKARDDARQKNKAAMDRYRLKKEVKQSELMRDIRETKAALKNQKNETSIMEKEFIRIAKAYEKLDAKSTAKSVKDTKAIADLKAALKEEAKKHRDDQKTWEAEFSRLMREYELSGRKIDRLEEKIERQKQAAKNKVENRRKAELRHKIQNFKKKLEAKLLRPTDRQYVPVDLIGAMVEVCNLIDTDTDLYKADGSINNAQVKRDETKEKLHNLKDEYEKLKNNSDPIYAGEFDEMVYAYLTELRDNFSGKSLKEMTTDELAEMYEILHAIDETLADARKLIGWGDAENVYEAGDSIVAEQDAIAKKRKNGKRNAVQKGWDTIDNLGLSPVRNVERMSGYNQDSALLKLFKKFEQGVRKKNKFKMDAYKLFEQLTSGKEYDDAIYNEVGGKKYTDVKGRQFGISKMQMMQAILSWERETANKSLHHIEQGGFTFADLDMLRKGNLKDAVSAENSHRVPAAVEMVAEFQEILKGDKWCQDYMAVARSFFNGMAKDAINETSIALKHRIIAKDKNYIPFEVDKNFVNTEITDMDAVQQTINSYGMLKDTKNHAPQALYITGLNNILDRHIEQVGTVYGLAIEVRNFNKVWNVRSQDESGNDPTVKESIDTNWGKEGVKHIEQAVKDIQGSRVRERNPLYDKAKSGYIGATFLLNLSVVTKQVGSLFSSTSMLRWRDPAKMIGNLIYTMANSEKISAEVDKYTATAWMRRQGMSDAELYTLMTQAKKPGLLKAMNKLPAVFNPTKWITAMDHAVALSLWKYAKQDTAKRTGLDGEALLKATAAFYDEVVENTQSMTDVLHRPEIQKRGDVLSESFAMFKTDLYQMAGQLQATAGRFMANKSEENGKALGRTVYAIAMGALWGSLMTTVFALLRYKVNRYRDDEDDELTLESWLKRQGFALVGDLAGYIFPIFGSEVVGVFENIMYGESDDVVDSIALTAINDLYSTMMTIGTSIKDGEMPDAAKMRQLAAKALQVFGIPANNILRALDAIKLHAEDIANGEFLSFNAGADSKTDDIYEAIIKGDQSYLARLKSTYKTDSAYQSAVRKGLRENDSRIHAAAQARYDGKTEEYKRIFREIQKEGKFSFDDIMSAINSEENAIRNKLEPDKATSSYTASGFVEAIILGDTSTAKAMREDIISTKVANGKTQVEAEKEFISAVATGIHDAYSSGLLDEARAENMLMEYAGKDEEEAASKVNYWAFCEEHPQYELTESNVADYQEFAEPAEISLDVFVQYINGTKGISTKYDQWGDVEQTVREQTLEVIDSLPLTWQQKDALYLAAGYSESKIWDVPW